MAVPQRWTTRGGWSRAYGTRVEARLEDGNAADDLGQRFGARPYGRRGALSDDEGVGADRR